MRWGLVPYWFKEADLSKLQINTSNCRSDTIMEKRSFKVGEARVPAVLGQNCRHLDACETAPDCPVCRCRVLFSVPR